MILYQLNKDKNLRESRIKKKGNSLVEVIAALAIILVAGEILFRSTVFSIKCRSVASESEEAIRIIHSLQKELKYNYKLVESSDLLKDGPLKYKNNNILMELKNKKLHELETGEDIMIELQSVSSNKLIFKIRYYFNSVEGKFIERVYTKYEWMEEI